MVPPGDSRTTSDLPEAPEPPLARLLVGRWITSFDLQFPEIGPPEWGGPEIHFIPTAFLTSFKFDLGGTFGLYQRRNKGGVFEPRSRGGTYTVRYQDTDFGIVGGEIAIESTDGIVLHYLMRNSDELHWIMDSSSGLLPVAQGTMYRVN